MRLLCVLIAPIMLASCGTSTFSGDAGRGDTVQTGGGGGAVAGPEAQETPANRQPGQGKLTSTEDREALAGCLAKWEGHPFGPDAADHVRKIHASVQVLGIGKGIVDDVPTPAPELILISAAVNVLGSTTYDLLNPNGWYCLKVDVNVKAETTVNLHCNARLADSKVDVAVGSASEPTGIVGVHVLSDVQVQHAGSCD